MLSMQRFCILESSHTEDNTVSICIYMLGAKKLELQCVCTLYMHYFQYRLLLVEQWNIIISASADTSVRVWTLEGNFIGTIPKMHERYTPHILCESYIVGTFGQESTWGLGISTTYQHPMKTKDLLFHTATSFTGPPASQDDEQPPSEADDEDTSKLQTPTRKTPAVQVHSELSVTEMEEEVCTL